jgi:hypothetical protein
LHTVPISYQANEENGSALFALRFVTRLKNISNISQKVRVTLKDLHIKYSMRFRNCEPFNVYCPSSGACTPATPAPAFGNTCYEMQICEDAIADSTGECANPCSTNEVDCRQQLKGLAVLRKRTSATVGGKTPEIKNTGVMYYKAAPSNPAFSGFTNPITFPNTTVFFTRDWKHSTLKKFMALTAEMPLYINNTASPDNKVTGYLATNLVIPAKSTALISSSMYCTANKEELKCNFAGNGPSSTLQHDPNRTHGCDENSTEPCVYLRSLNVTAAFEIGVFNHRGAILGSTNLDIDLEEDEPVTVQSTPLNGGRPF